jgi:hypothetical protein
MVTGSSTTVLKGPLLVVLVRFWDGPASAQTGEEHLGVTRATIRISPWDLLKKLFVF